MFGKTRDFEQGGVCSPMLGYNPGVCPTDPYLPTVSPQGHPYVGDMPQYKPGDAQADAVSWTEAYWGKAISELPRQAVEQSLEAWFCYYNQAICDELWRAGQRDFAKGVARLLVGIGVGILVGVAAAAVCTTGIGCVIVVGAISGAASSGSVYLFDVGQGDREYTGDDLATDMVEGAVVGAVTGVVFVKLSGAAKLCSFSGETPVLMADGSVEPIEKIKTGDSVVATSRDSGVTTRRQVTALHVNADADLTDVTLETADGHHAKIHTTQNHPFWDVTAQAWVAAGQLQTGHELATPDGTQAKVADVSNFVGHETMYNLTVADIHTYYVVAGTTPVLVHNCPAWSPDTGGKLPESWGSGSPNKKGIGSRWQDPGNPGSGVRIDQGNPNSPFPSQQVDHVIVRDNGKVIGRDGKPIRGSINEDPTNAHIPLSEWLNWSSWNTP